MLNPSQQQALCAFDQHDRINLVAPGGYGKTFTVQEYIRTLPRDSLAVLSPTHKAAAVLAERMPGLSVQTIDSFLGYRMVTNPVTLVDEFRMPGKWVLVDKSGRATDIVSSHTRWKYRSAPLTMARKASVLVVDEASMVPKDRYDAILRHADRAGARLLLSGDPFQLPPVKSKAPFPEPSFRTVALTEPCRTDHADLLALCDTVRGCIARNEPLPPFRNSEHVAIASAPRDGDLVLAWTNRAVDAWNTRLRPPGTVRYVEHDMLITTRPCKDPQFRESLHNGSRFRVEAVTRRTIDYTSTAFHDVYSFDVVELRTDQPRPDGEGLATVTFVDPDGDASGFRDLLARLKRGAKNARSAREATACLAEIAFLRSFGEHTPPVSYGFALTVHKSQGSTYDHVAIDMEDLARCRGSEILRLLYVALTRARKTVTLIRSNRIL